MKKPVITIEDGRLNLSITLSEDFNDTNMVEKYTKLQMIADTIETAMAMPADDNYEIEGEIPNEA